MFLRTIFFVKLVMRLRFSERNTRLKYMNSMLINAQQWQLNNKRMKDTNATITLLEK